MARARRATASWPSRYDTLGNSTESFIAAGGYHHTWNEAGMRILVVEDERKVASFIRQGLEEEGHTVEVATDGAAALDLMVAGPPHDLVVLDPSTREVTRGQRKVALTAREYALLEYFMRNVGRVLTRPMIAEHVWGLDFDPESNIIDVYVGYLRRKIDGEGEHRLLHTMRGAGYVMRMDAA